MEERTRVVVYGSSLHMAGIVTSLGAEADLEVVCVAPDSPTAQQDLIEFDPAVITFDLSDPCLDLDIRLLRQRPGLLLIGADPSSDELLVLSSRPAQALSMADLVDVICRKGSNSRTVR